MIYLFVCPGIFWIIFLVSSCGARPVDQTQVPKGRSRTSLVSKFFTVILFSITSVTKCLVKMLMPSFLKWFSVYSWIYRRKKLSEQWTENIWKWVAFLSLVCYFLFIFYIQNFCFQFILLFFMHSVFCAFFCAFSSFSSVLFFFMHSFSCSLLNSTHSFEFHLHYTWKVL